ncbi:sulfatase [Myxococcota bacterium]|nr:sulfatase [Myxococcota bacterium]
MRLLSTALLALLASAPALAANPFTEPGTNGVGKGMRAMPGTAAGSLVRLEDGTARLDAAGAKTVAICTDQLQAVQGRVLVEGRFKTQGVSGPQGWNGARVKVYYFDGADQRIKGEKYQPELVFKRGDNDWVDFTQAIVVPEGAVKARLCGELVNVEAGSAWFQDLALVAMSTTATAAAGGPGATAGKNVLWILVDTLRADALGTYGNSLPVSPQIDAFAASALTYEHAWTQYTWTVPSTISFFTSQHARSHGWNSTFDKVAAGEYTAMGTEVPTLAEVLRGQGYVTSAYYANGLLKTGIGVNRGFLTWRHGNDEEVVKRATDDINLWGGDGAPNFLYVHLMTPHIPLRPTGAAQKAAGISVQVPEGGFRYWEGEAQKMPQEEYNALFKQVYTAAVFDADRYVGQVLAALEKAGHADDTIVVLTADHGELLGEHNVLGHGSYVYEGLSHVPLIVRAPGQSPKRVSDRVGRTIDIAPTVLDWLDLEKKQPKGWQGLSLFTAAPGLTAVVERDSMVAFTTDGQYKIVENRENTSLLRAYDLEADPGEQASVAEAGGAWIEALRKAATKWRNSTLMPGQEVLQTRQVIQKTDKDKEEELDMLRALGYVE